MALARSASGPGGLSINTSSANSLFGSGTAPAGGMFGATQASKPLFGASATTTAPASGSLFGTAPTSQPQTGGLFGSATPASQPQSGGLFGSTAATSQPQSGGLFGSTAVSQPQTGGLFGTTPAVSQPQTGGLFGSTTAASQPQTGGLFGSTATSQPQTGGLFGSSTTAAQPQTGGLFGSTTASTQAPASGLFGAAKPSGGLFGSAPQPAAGSLFGAGSTAQTQQPQQSSMFSGANQPVSGSGAVGSMFGGGLTMGQSRNLQPQTIPGVKIDMANLRGTTRFNDLHEELQKQVELMDNVIQGQIKLMNDCNAIMAPHDSQLATVPSDVEFLRRKLVGLESAMAADAEAISHIREFIRTDVENATLSFRAIHNLQLPSQYHISGVWPTKPSSGDNQTHGGSDVQDIVGFFSANADELAATLAKYQKHITEIEQHLRSVEDSSAQQINSLIARRNDASAGDDDEIRQLAFALTEFEQSILHVAGKVGGLREGIQKLQLGNFMGVPNSRAANGYRSSVY